MNKAGDEEVKEKFNLAKHNLQEQLKAQLAYDSDDDLDNYVPKGLTDQQVQENIEYFESHPLFMKELPKDLEKNQHITAL